MTFSLKLPPMKLPQEVPVMTLPNATLFPQSLLPLYIFEPRYRRMLADSLDTNRMFSVAMQKPGRTRETPSPGRGAGVDPRFRGASATALRTSCCKASPASNWRRPSVTNLIASSASGRWKRLPATTPSWMVCSPKSANCLPNGSRWVCFCLSRSFPKASRVEPPPGVSAKEVLGYLDKLTDPEQVADLVSCAVLSGPAERQTILETVNLESRLQRLIHFLMAEISRQRKDKHQ